MDKKLIGPLAIGVIVVYSLVGDERPIEVGEKCSRQSVAAKGVDGGLVYICPVQTDAGEEIRIVGPTHKRRLAGRDRCTFPDGGVPGLMNRYDSLIGVDCESVAGGVIFGEDADDTEDNIISRQK